MTRTHRHNDSRRELIDSARQAEIELAGQIGAKVRNFLISRFIETERPRELQ